MKKLVLRKWKTKISNPIRTSLFSNIFYSLFSIFPVLAIGQNMSINANGAPPDSSAMLDVSSTTRGVLLPRMTQTQRLAITNPAHGLMVVQVDSVGGLYVYSDSANSWYRFTLDGDTTLDLASVLGIGNDADSQNILNVGSMGIGTSTPQTDLHVVTDNNDFGFMVSEADSGTEVGTYVGSGSDSLAKGWLGTNSQHDLAFYTGNSWEQMVLQKNTGNVGIGTYTPQRRLDVSSTEGSGPVATFRNPSSWSSVDILSSTTGEGAVRFGENDNTLFGGLRWDPATNAMHLFTMNNADYGVRVYSDNTVTLNSSVAVHADSTLAVNNGAFTVFHPEKTVSINTTAYEASTELYVWRNADSSTIDFGANRSNIYAWRNGHGYEADGGTSWHNYGVDAAIKGTSWYGNNYTAGVAGYNYNDFASSAGVIGSQFGGDYWGALGYRDTNYNEWGLYTPHDAHVGSLSVNGAYALPTTDGTTTQVLTTNGSGTVTWAAPTGDNLGNHTATQNIVLNSRYLSNDGGNEGISVDNNGNTTITGTSLGQVLAINGFVRTSPQGSGIEFTNNQISITGNNGNTGDMIFETGSTDRIRITGGGQVGIGTNTPSEKLHVIGNVAIPAANNYTYTSAKTQYETVSHATFTLATTTTGVLAYRPLTSGFNYILMTQSGTAGTATYFVAPVNLPDGAVVTDVAAHFYDNDATYNCSVDLVRQIYSGPSLSSMATLATSGQPAQTTLNTSTITNATINNSTYAYFLQFGTRENNQNLGLYNVRITYTVTQAD